MADTLLENGIGIEQKPIIIDDVIKQEVPDIDYETEVDHLYYTDVETQVLTRKKQQEKFMASRGKRTTTWQMEILLDYLTQHPTLLSTTNCHPKKQKSLEVKWKQLTGLLNAARGAKKTPDQWRKFLGEWKCKTRKKAREPKKHATSTNKAGFVVRYELTELERRLLTLLTGPGGLRPPSPPPAADNLRVEDKVQQSPEVVVASASTSAKIHDEDSPQYITIATELFADLGTERCLENIKLVIRDFETQLDWHLRSYMELKDMFIQARKDNNNDFSDGGGSSSVAGSRGNKRKGGGGTANGSNAKKRKTGGGRKKDDDTDTDTEDSEEDEEDYSDSEEEEEEDYDSEEDPDDPKPTKGKAKAKSPAAAKGGKKAAAAPKKGGKAAKKEDATVSIKTESDDDIDEEFNELIVPKSETGDDEDSMSYQDSNADISSNTGDDVGFRKMTAGKAAAAAAAASPKKGKGAATPAAKKGAAAGGRGKKAAPKDSDSEDYAPPAKGKKAASPKKTPAAKTPAAKKPPAAKKTPAAGGRGKKGAAAQAAAAAAAAEAAAAAAAAKPSSSSAHFGEGDEDEHEDKKPTNEELVELIRPKLIDTLEAFKKSMSKPLVLLEESNVDDFDYENDIKDSDFLITCEDADDLPSFIFDNKEIVAQILGGSIKVVLESVYDEHMNEQQNQ